MVATLIDPESVQRTVLPNGLTVLLRVDRSAPVAAIVTHVKAGYFDETDDIVGIAHVLEHMFFKGTARRGVGEIAKETKASGGYLNAHTIYDNTTYFTVLPASGFAAGLDIQADAYANSDRRRRALERARGDHPGSEAKSGHPGGARGGDAVRADPRRSIGFVGGESGAKRDCGSSRAISSSGSTGISIARRTRF